MPAPLPEAASAREFEAEYLRTTDAADRARLAPALASLDDADANETVARLFRIERVAAVREALVSALADTQRDTHLEAKLRLVTAALDRGQPRNVRRAALDVAAYLEDPRGLQLLRRAAKSDPDHELRDTAGALATALASQCR